MLCASLPAQRRPSHGAAALPEQREKLLSPLHGCGTGSKVTDSSLGAHGDLTQLPWCCCWRTKAGDPLCEEQGDGEGEGRRTKAERKAKTPLRTPPTSTLQSSCSHWENIPVLTAQVCCFVYLGDFRVNYRNRPVYFTLIFRQVHFQPLLHKQHATIWGLQRLQGNIDFLTITLKQCSTQHFLKAFTKHTF